MANTTTEKFYSKNGKLKDLKNENVISIEGKKGQPPTPPSDKTTKITV
jgi:hypothetical protein